MAALACQSLLAASIASSLSCTARHPARQTLNENRSSCNVLALRASQSQSRASITRAPALLQRSHVGQQLSFAHVKPLRNTVGPCGRRVAARADAGNESKAEEKAAGLDSAQSGNVVQLLVVLGLMLGWTATYVFRVGNKEMTYVQQLKDYEDKVMQKRLEELPEAELEAMLAEIEEEKKRIQEKRRRKANSS
eukprot:jgi/Mesen1/4130/ME000218S03242